MATAFQHFCGDELLGVLLPALPDSAESALSQVLPLGKLSGGESVGRRVHPAGQQWNQREKRLTFLQECCSLDLKHLLSEIVEVME